MSRDELSALADGVLLSRIKRLAAAERAATLNIIHHLIEIERRKLHLSVGFASMFDYCTRELGYSSSAAGRRIQAARCVRRFPEVGRLLASNAVTLSTISLIAPVLKRENARSILERVQGKPQREVETLVAQYRPPVALRDRVRPVSVAVAVRESRPVLMGGDYSRSGSDASSVEGKAEVTAEVAEQARTAGRSSDARPEGACDTRPDGALDRQGRRQRIATGGQTPAVRIERKLLVQFLVNPEFMRLYNEAHALLSTRMPRASFGDVFKAVLEEFVERHSPARRNARRVARVASRGAQAKKPMDTSQGEQTRKPDDTRRGSQRERPCANQRGSQPVRATKRGPEQSTREPRRNPQPLGRHIPARIRDEVYERDGGRCTFVGRNGARCGSRHNLHVDHIEPFALGGTHEPSNLRLLCATHNQLAAENAYGSSKIRGFMNSSGRQLE